MSKRSRLFGLFSKGLNMRANTSALYASPEVSIITGTDGRPWVRGKFPSLQALHALVKTHARTENERNWADPSFIGLRFQSRASFDSTGKADAAYAAFSKALGALPEKRIPSTIRPAISGAVWSVPDVMAGVPLAARTRMRIKVAPLNLRLGIDFSSGVSAETVAPYTARIAKAIWAYHEAGGVVSLTMIHFTVTLPDDGARFYSETAINTSDSATLSVALSPIMARALVYPFFSALSKATRDPLPMSYDHDTIPGGVHMLKGSSACDFAESAEKIIAQLRITS